MKISHYVIDAIKNKYSIVDYLAKNGIHSSRAYQGRIAYLCPIHKTDTKPSFIVYDDDVERGQNYFCFGCIEENELIWTSNGLKKIKDVRCGDEIIDQQGSFKQVSAIKYSKNKTMLKLKTAAFSEPLLLTPDHKCIVLTKEDIIKHFPYIKYRTDINTFSNYEIRFFGNLYKKCYGLDKKIAITEKNAEDIKKDDFIIYPVINDDCRKNNNLSGKNIIKKYTKGPRNKRIKFLHVNEKTARLYGLWVAEGSYSHRNIMWTFNINEKNTFAKDIKNILKSEFGLNCKIYERPERNTCDVVCSKVDLGKQLGYFFGLGSHNKKIPTQALYWSGNVQKSFLQGYFDGDGNKQGMALTCSRKLAYGIFAMAIQCKQKPYLFFHRDRIDKNHIYHSPYWGVNIKQLNSLSGFFEKINDNVYYISIVKDVFKSKTNKNVMDISVEKSEMFLTKLGIVHNCKKSGSIINLISIIEHVSLQSVIEKLSDSIVINDKVELDYVLNLIKDDNNRVEDKARNDARHFAVISLSLSAICRDHLISCEYDEEEFNFLEKLYEKIDKFIWFYDFESLENLYNYIVDKEIIVDGRIYHNPIHFRKVRWDNKRQKELLQEVQNQERYKNEIKNENYNEDKL